MKLSIFLILFATTQCVCSTSRTEPTTLRIEERIKLLKSQIRQSLRHPLRSDPLPAIYDEDALIPPILDNEALKRNDKYWPKTINASKAARTLSTTKRTVRFLPSSKRPHVIHRAPKTQKPKNVTIKNLTSISTQINFTEVAAPLLQQTKGSWSFDIFYRKSFPFLNTPFEWIHCSELITPLINGFKNELTEPKKLLESDTVIVQRLLHLLALNVTGYSREEKRAFMYHVSKLKIRLFTWDVNAMVGLMEVLMAAGETTGKPSFAGLKLGMQTIIAGWSMDLSNITTLLLQSKIFRPPCIQTPQSFTGSSKFIRGATVPSRNTSPKNKKKECLFRAFEDNKDNCR